jgi:heme-degrading monooxygenase HmoA
VTVWGQNLGPIPHRHVCRWQIIDHRDEKSVIRWRTESEHHGVQEKGRTEIFQDCHLRVGEIVSDTTPATNASVHEQRFDATESGDAKYASFTEITPQSAQAFGIEPGMIPARLGLVLSTAGLTGHDIFKSITAAGKCVLLCSWKGAQAAKSWTPQSFDGVKEIRHRVVRVVRDYGMFDRREAPQYFPDVKQS